MAFLPIGTDVADAGPAGFDKTWVHVRLADNREGWLLVSLTREIDGAHRLAAVESIVVDRLGRRGDAFATTAELADFVERERVAVTERETAARFDLYRLRAVAAVLQTIHAGQSKRDPYLSWLDRHRSLVVYDEPGSIWLLSNAAVWKVHDEHAGATAADEIAWVASTTGLPGECAGSLVCYVESLNTLYGEYLRRHPSGRHVDDVALSIRGAANELSSAGRARVLYVFDRQRDCAPFGKALEAIAAAVSKSSALAKDDTLQSLAAVRGACGSR